MQVRVLFFGLLKDLVGTAEETLELSDGATVDELMGSYEAKVPRLAEFAASIAISVNREYCRRDVILHNQDEVAMLPPVSGGADPAGGPAREPDVRLVRGRINAENIIAAMKKASDGAVVVFDGIVRDNSRGRRTLYLDYEAYDAMALQQLKGLVAEAVRRFGIRDATVVHRLGRVEVGETSVLIVAASAHRAAAFDACRWLIDTMKKTVPVWKKEQFEDGAVWADGEPFPPEISAGEGSHRSESH